MANKWVYIFTEGNMTMRNLLGGKGANLAEMTELDFLYHRASQSQLKLVHSITRMEKINDEIMAQTMECKDGRD